MKKFPLDNLFLAKFYIIIEITVSTQNERWSFGVASFKFKFMIFYINACNNKVRFYK